MRRVLILLSHRNQVGLFDRLLPKFTHNNDEIIIASLTPEASLSDEMAKRIARHGARSINFSDLKMGQSHGKLSLMTTPLIQAALDQILGLSELRECSTYMGVSLLSTQANSIYTFGYRHLIAAIERMRVLVEQEQPDLILTFGLSKQIFRYLERPDIERLYDVEMIYGYLIMAVAQELGIQYQVVKNVSSLWGSMKLRVRAILMRAYKFYALSKRVWRDRRFRISALKPDSASKPRICIVLRGESEYWTVRPALQKLREADEFEAVILQDDIIKDPSARAVLERFSESFVPVHALTTPTEFVRLFFQGIRMSGRFDWSLSSLSLDNTSNVNSESVHERVLGGDDAYAREVVRSMSKRFSEELIFVHELRKFIEIYHPALLVTMSMVDNWGPLIAETGHEYGIQTLAIQNAAQAFLSMPIMVFADKYAVASQRQRNGLVEIGAYPERVIVTGIPRYDPYFSERPDPAPERQALGIMPDQKLVLITTQPTLHYENVEYIKMALESLSRFPNVSTLIKLHPRERLADYGEIRTFIDEGQHNAQIVQHRDVLKLINASELMLSRVSTTIQSALMIGTPVIAYISPANPHAQRDYLEAPAVMKISELAQLPEVLEKWMTEYPKQQEIFADHRNSYLKETVGVADGKASERILNLIREMTQS